MQKKNHYMPWSPDSSDAQTFLPCSFSDLVSFSTLCSPPQFDTVESICNNICGNFSLQGDTKSLKIWKEKVFKNNIVSITLFNSSHSESSIEVKVEPTKGEKVVFTIPPGNSLSRTIKDVHSIKIKRIGDEQSDGKFCLDICFIEHHRDKYIYEKRVYEKYICHPCKSVSCHCHKCSDDNKKHDDKCAEDNKKHSDKCAEDNKKHSNKCAEDNKKHYD